MSQGREHTLFAATVDPLSGQTRWTAPHNGTATSKAAARAIVKTGGATTGRYMVLKMLAAPRWRDGATREDVEDTTGLITQSACPRIKDLVNDGLVKVIGERKLRSGRNGDVYAITPAGVAAMGGGQ